MPRLIDADALSIQVMDASYWDNQDEDVIWNLVQDAPTVDAVEVVHGEWVQIGYDKAMDRITCSCCKEYWNIADNDTESFNYCPNCGAKMDGGNEDLNHACTKFKDSTNYVQVVRCEDCKWYEANCETCVLHSDDGDTYDCGFDVNMKPDDFCSYGERREGE